MIQRRPEPDNHGCDVFSDEERLWHTTAVQDPITVVRDFRDMLCPTSGGRMTLDMGAGNVAC